MGGGRRGEGMRGLTTIKEGLSGATPSAKEDKRELGNGEEGGEKGNKNEKDLGGVGRTKR